MLDLSKFKKTVASPYTGQEYEIVRVTRREVLEMTGVLPIVLAAPVEKRLQALETALKERADNGDIQEQVTRDMLAKGVLSPRIWLGDGECPENQLPIGYMGDDRDWLAGEVIKFAYDISALNMDKFFRGPEPADPGPSGAEVRAEAVEPNPDGDGAVHGP
jgi:hypothetical protein